jgi:hypothetical protein
MTPEQLDLIPTRLLLARDTSWLIEWLAARGLKMTLLEIEQERQRRRRERDPR